MLTALHLKSASSSGQKSLDLLLKPSVTIFVGPNNSGKSLLLREITEFCKSGSRGAHTQILDRLDCVTVDRATAEADLARIERRPEPNETMSAAHIPVLIGGSRNSVHKSTYIAVRENPSANFSYFTQMHLGPSTLSLDGPTRIVF